MTFSARDEQPHSPGAHPYWNESFYFNFFDNEAGWAGATRIGFSPNRGHAEAFLCLYFPGGEGGFVRSWRELSGRGDSTRVESFDFEMIEPFRVWRVRYAGPVFFFEDPEMMADHGRTHFAELPTRRIELDLELSALHEPYDFHASGKRQLLPAAQLVGKLRPSYFFSHLNRGIHAARSLRAMSGASHYEQACTFVGSVRIDTGAPREISGTGQRDHSWGVRDMRVPTKWRWFSCQFGDELAFNATRVEVLGLEAVGGYAFYKDRPQGLRDWQLELNDAFGREAILHLCLEDGDELRFRVETCTNLPVVVTTEGVCTVVNEARARFHWERPDGELSSYGISELMEQIHR